MKLKTEYQKIQPYTTKDGSLVRELMHPDMQGNSNQSLAEATISANSATALHRHHRFEEIYHITEGRGLMTLEEKTFRITAGDTIYIPAGTAHRIQNTSNSLLKLLCCCAPPYSHDDTELLEEI